ncbi:MAG: tetratricopeptide repeat protein [Pirellulales bacterium]|nr:tetratricopeptide repeat protein [Pirellulales bacterium]
MDTQIGVCVFLTSLLATAWFFHPAEYANSETRMALVRAMVDDHTFAIDRYHERTIDKALVNGHYYCDKAPGASFWGVPVYWLARQAADFFMQPLDEQLARYVTRLWVSSVPAAVVSWLVWLALRGLGVVRWPAALLACLAVVGTCAWPYGSLVYGHELAAMFLMAAFVLIVAPERPVDFLPGAGRMALAGLCIGCGVLTEYPVVLGGALLGGYALWRLRRIGPLAWYLVGGVPAALALAGYNTVNFGGPLTSGYSFEVNQVFQTGMEQGVGGVTWPRWSAVRLITLSLSRGLFALSPFLLLAVPGCDAVWRRAKRRAPWVVSLAIAIAFVLFNASYYMPDGGFACGPRHLLPAVPFVVLLSGAAFLPDSHPIGWPILLGLAVPSVFINGLAVAIEPHIDPRLAYPVGDFWFPVIMLGGHAVNGGTLIGCSLGTSLVLLGLLIGGVWMTLLFQPAGELDEAPPPTPAGPWYVLAVILPVAVLVPHLMFRAPGPRAALYRATALFNQGKKEAALSELGRVMMTPAVTEEDRVIKSSAAYYLGRIAGPAQGPEAALHWFYKAVELNPKLAELHVDIAGQLLLLGRVEEAERELQLAEEKQPGLRAQWEARLPMPASP